MQTDFDHRRDRISAAANKALRVFFSRRRRWCFDGMIHDTDERCDVVVSVRVSDWHLRAFKANCIQHIWLVGFA